MFKKLTVKCCICQSSMDYNRRYGREACTCSKECYKEFQRRYAEMIVNQPEKEEANE